MRAAIALLVMLAGEPVTDPDWLVAARRCVAMHEGWSRTDRSLEALHEIGEAQQRVRDAGPPEPSALKALLASDSPDRSAALAAMALHAVNSDDLVAIVATRYRRADSLPARFYGAQVLGSMTREQVARHADQLARAAREEAGTFVPAALGPAVRKLAPAPMVELLADVAVAGSPVVALLTARDAGEVRVRELDESLERRGAVCPLYVVRAVARQMRPKGQQGEPLEPPPRCDADRGAGPGGSSVGELVRALSRGEREW